MDKRISNQLFKSFLHFLRITHAQNLFRIHTRNKMNQILITKTSDLPTDRTFWIKMNEISAESEGFEPSVPFWGTPAFQASPFDHSGNSLFGPTKIIIFFNLHQGNSVFYESFSKISDLD